MISLQSLFLSATTAFLTRYADGSPNGLVNKGITVLFSIIPKYKYSVFDIFITVHTIDNPRNSKR